MASENKATMAHSKIHQKSPIDVRWETSQIIPVKRGIPKITAINNVLNKSEKKIFKFILLKLITANLLLFG